MARQTATLLVPARPAWHYEIRIGDGLLKQVLAELERDWPERRLFIVTDANVARHGHLAALGAGRDLDPFVVDPPGEGAKTLATVGAVLGAMEAKGLGRDTLLVALGGGTVGDLGGFAAAIFKRGVPYVQAPTTTVSQADSAIGGKVGVDSDLSKNAYGAFHHPVRVYMDTATLGTLDARPYRAGLAESVKHALIADADYFAWWEANAGAVLARRADALAHLCERNCAIKGDVVQRDPDERNLRRILNFGHTVGHAVEAASGYALLHGESVAIGMVAACRIGERMGVTPAEVGRRLRALLDALGLPATLPPSVAPEALRDIMSRDKKAVGGQPRFVILEGVGRVHAPEGTCAVPVAPEVIGGVLSEMSEAGGAPAA